MPGLPQLIEEDIQALDECLASFLERTDATLALILDKAGFTIAQSGNTSDLDVTTIGALAANAYAASQALAGLIQEPQFNALYQQGTQSSLLACNVDEDCLLLTVFRAGLSVGAVKYYSQGTSAHIAAQIVKARQRHPGKTLDLSSTNLADPSSLFRSGSH